MNSAVAPLVLTPFAPFRAAAAGAVGLQLEGLRAGVLAALDLGASVAVQLHMNVYTYIHI